MMMPVFLVVLAVACDNAEQPKQKTSAGMVFVFNADTSVSVDDYVYASYIPLENLKKSKAKLVSGEYVRYHKDHKIVRLLFFQPLHERPEFFPASEHS